MKLRAFLIDDEPLALDKLGRLLEDSGRVAIIGRATDPEAALETLIATPVDVLFLDIQMPGMSGFELIARLPHDPLVVFTTAYNQYALQAFEVSSVDYLLKPVEPQPLERALGKLERIHRGNESRPDVAAMARELATALAVRRARYPERLPSRLGDKVQLVELAQVTHIFAKDKLTYAAASGKDYCLDATVSELERKLDPQKFVRIHRSTIVNLSYVHELYSWFAGRMLLRLKDDKNTQLTVARDRVSHLKESLGL